MSHIQGKQGSGFVVLSLVGSFLFVVGGTTVSNAVAIFFGVVDGRPGFFVLGGTSVGSKRFEWCCSGQICDGRSNRNRRSGCHLDESELASSSKESGLQSPYV